MPQRRGAHAAVERARSRDRRVRRRRRDACAQPHRRPADSRPGRRRLGTAARRRASSCSSTTRSRRATGSRSCIAWAFRPRWTCASTGRRGGAAARRLPHRAAARASCSPATSRRCAARRLHGGVREVNVGGIHHRAGRTQHLRYVFLTPDEQRALRDARRARRARHRAGRARGARRSRSRSCSPNGESDVVSELLPLALLGGVLGLDVVCFPQMMISRPLVARDGRRRVRRRRDHRAARRRDARADRARDAAVRRVALSRVGLGGGRRRRDRRARCTTRARRRADRRRARGARHRVGRRLDAGEAAPAGTRGSRGRERAALERGLARRGRSGCSSPGSPRTSCARWLLTAVAYALLFPVAHATRRRSGRSSEPLSRAVVVGAASAVAAAAAWTIFHSARGARWYFAGGLRGRAPAPARSDDRRRRAPLSRARPDAARLGAHLGEHVRAPARHPGLVELRDAARQRHRLLRRAGAAAAARRRARRRVQGGAGARERVLQRASVPRVRRGRRARARRARWRAARAHRALPHGALRPARQRRRPARVGRLASVLLARRARRVRARRAAARRRADCSSCSTTPATSALRIWGLHVGLDARTARRQRARQSGAAPRAGVHRARRRRRRRHRAPARRCAASSVRDALLLGGVLGAVAAGRRRCSCACTAASKGGSSSLVLIALFVLFSVVR